MKFLGDAILTDLRTITDLLGRLAAARTGSA